MGQVTLPARASARWPVQAPFRGYSACLSFGATRAQTSHVAEPEVVLGARPGGGSSHPRDLGVNMGLRCNVDHEIQRRPTDTQAHARLVRTTLA